MLISEYGGENAVIKLIEHLYQGGNDPRVVVGYGDDGAVIRTGGERLLIVTTDLLAENTHFRQDTIDPYSLGWKSVAVNISDIAAMGGEPTWAFVSLALPDMAIEHVEQLYCGMNDISSQFGSWIIGGDTNRVDGSIVINLTQLGEVEEHRVALRSKAMPGDRILVTGTLGDSLAGYRLLEQLGRENALSSHPKLVERHIRPVPRVREARAASNRGLIRAMMDISDGLAIDLGKMCAASGVGARVYAENLPTSAELKTASAVLNADHTGLAASGGEDYELLIAAAEEDVAVIREVIESATGTDVTVIGEFVSDNSIQMVMADGQELNLEPGWTHFEDAS